MRPKRCAHCMGRFGLIRHRYAGKQFCSNTQGKRCKQLFIEDMAFKTLQQTFFQWLSK